MKWHVCWKCCVIASLLGLLPALKLVMGWGVYLVCTISMTSAVTASAATSPVATTHPTSCVRVCNMIGSEDSACFGIVFDKDPTFFGKAEAASITMESKSGVTIDATLVVV